MATSKAVKKPTTSEIIGNIDPKHWVQKSDPLIMMRSVPFSLGELKILDTYISRINAADNSRNTVIFTKSEYEELMNLTDANPRALNKHTKGMLGKVVELNMPNGDYMQFVLFEQALYCKDDYGVPIVKLTCTSTARELFFCIDKFHYFKYALENVIHLTRKASYLLYVYIVANRYRKIWSISLDELRDSILDCKTQESYKVFKEFKRAVLDPAVKEINKKTDCSFDYETSKRGRSVAEIKFIYHSSNKFSDIDTNQLTFDDDKQENNYTDERLSFLAEACNNEFTEEQMQVLYDILRKIEPNSHGTARYDYLLKKYNELKYRVSRSDLKPLRSRFAYLKKIIEADVQED